jgi:flavin-dependent dehydrogenase
VNAETFKSRAVINAAGRWSLLTRAENRTRAAAERWIGVKAHFHEAKPSSTVDLYFFPGGYCGVQPVALPQGDSGDAIVNACAMVRAEVATSLNEVLKLHPALRERAQTWRPAIDQVSTSPLIFHKPEPLNRTILQAGDAATFVDPFIGDGISLALRSGVLAARCLQACLRGSASLAQSAHQYEQLYAERLAPVFWASSLLRSLLRMPKILRRPAMSVLQHTPAVTRQIVRITR